MKGIFLGTDNNLIKSSFDIGDMLADIDVVNLENELKSNSNEYFYKAFF